MKELIERIEGAEADLITMTMAQVAVLHRMNDELGYPFRDIASDCGLPIKLVRDIVRGFHRCGLTGYGPLFSEDGPAIRGAGYWLRKPGWELQKRLGQFFTMAELGRMNDPF